MAELLLLPEAINDLERIYEYTYAKWGAKQADRYQDELYGGMQTIQVNREIGVEYVSKPGGYRKYQVKKHLLFYRNEGEAVIVVRILHEQMNPTDKL